MQMEMRSGLEGLKTLLGILSTSAAQPRQQVKSGPPPSAGALAGDQATLSNAGSEVSQAAGDSGVRMEKVAAVQAALAAGTYNVPATDVAGKLIEAMLGGAESPGR
jgi:negative regulator of flagellin synthesis FlgM